MERERGEMPPICVGFPGAACELRSSGRVELRWEAVEGHAIGGYLRYDAVD